MKSLCPLLAAVAVGCGGAPSPEFVNAQQNVVTWRVKKIGDVVQPGVNQAAVFHKGTYFAVWSDGTGISFNATNTSSSAKIEGTIRPGGGKRDVEVAIDSLNGKSGSLKVNDASHSLATGNLILIAVSGDKPRVKQLTRDLSKTAFDAASLQKLAESDSEISGFFGGK